MGLYMMVDSSVLRQLTSLPHVPYHKWCRVVVMHGDLTCIEESRVKTYICHECFISRREVCETSGLPANWTCSWIRANSDSTELSKRTEGFFSVWVLKALRTGLGKSPNRRLSAADRVNGEHCQGLLKALSGPLYSKDDGNKNIRYSIGPHNGTPPHNGMTSLSLK